MGVLVYYCFPFILYQALYRCAGVAGHAGVKTLASCSGARIHGVYAHTPFFIHEIGVHGLHTLHSGIRSVTVGAIKNPSGEGRCWALGVVLDEREGFAVAFGGVAIV